LLYFIDRVGLPLKFAHLPRVPPACLPVPVPVLAVQILSAFWIVAFPHKEQVVAPSGVGIHLTKLSAQGGPESAQARTRTPTPWMDHFRGASTTRRERTSKPGGWLMTGISSSNTHIIISWCRRSRRCGVRAIFSCRQSCWMLLTRPACLLCWLVVCSARQEVATSWENVADRPW